VANFDSAPKRYSGLGIDLPWPLMLPAPDGTISATDRQHWVRKYVGVAWSVASGYGIDDLTTCVAFHLRTLLPGEQSDEYRTYLNGVRGSTGELDDLNTAQWVDLNF
jgi:hypothetical protein